MNDPSPDTELDAEALAMLSAFRADERPPASVRSRVWSRIEAQPVAPPIAASGAGSLKWVGLGVAMAAGLVLAVAGFRGSLLEENEASEPMRPEAALQHEVVESGGDTEIKEAAPKKPVAPRPTPAVAPAEDVDPPPRASAPSEEPVDTARHRPSNRDARKDTPETADLAGTLGEETKLLKQARVALAAGNATRCLESLKTHAREFPSGVLAEERDALRAVALCTGGRQTEGERAAKTFATRHPGSPLLARVRGACGKP